MVKVVFRQAGHFLVVFILLGSPILAIPSQSDTSVQTAWRLLDYIAVDYRQAVKNETIINSEEYAEMNEFAKSAREKIDALKSRPAKAALQHQAAALQQLITFKAPPQTVANASRRLASRLLAAYPVTLAPPEAPDLDRGVTLYLQQCATCHGVTGNGKGPGAAGLEPPPIAFSDKDRAQERSLFGLYQVIEQGLDGTAMRSYADLPVKDRWALAFYVSTLAYPDGKTDDARQAWETDARLAQNTTLEEFVGMTPASLVAEIGQQKGDLITGYLRSHPLVLMKVTSSPLALARTRLKESVASYEAGDKKRATELALSAYLDGFEPMETVLASRDRNLLSQVEAAMAALRASISQDASVADVRIKAETVMLLFTQADNAVAPNSASGVSSFFGSFAILLREGLEALLIVVAMLSFLRKANRTDLNLYVHGGWVSALVCGVATWAIATKLIAISGATREMTEGLGSTFAALVLLWVGVWMHGKSNAVVWQKYVRDNLTAALNRRSAWFLFGLSFLVVYREVFETILFYAAVWSQGNETAVVTGALTACLVLALIAVAILRYSRFLPINKFFSYSSSLIAVLAVVLVGKGVSALQEAGWASLHPLAELPLIELVGFYPTAETVAAQMLMTGLLIIGFFNNWRTSPKGAR